MGLPFRAWNEREKERREGRREGMGLGGKKKKKKKEKKKKRQGEKEGKKKKRKEDRKKRERRKERKKKRREKGGREEGKGGREEGRQEGERALQAYFCGVIGSPHWASRSESPKPHHERVHFGPAPHPEDGSKPDQVRLSLGTRPSWSSRKPGSQGKRGEGKPEVA